MNRRVFLATAGAAAVVSASCQKSWSQSGKVPLEHQLPTNDSDYNRSKSYIEEVPISQYHWASDRAVEAFKDMKFGLRIHWGLYSLYGRPGESWPFLKLNFEERQNYNQAYKTWNPIEFDADAWMNVCEDAGMKMFAFTTKHHEGFSMFDTKTRVRSRANWTSAGAPKLEDCDLAYSIMETPFRRDVVRELTAAAHKRNIKIDLYFSHSDWYDADFRPYGWHPLQVSSSEKLVAPAAENGTGDAFWANMKKRMNGQLVVVPDPTPEEVKRMVRRHRAQLHELLTSYGTIDMMCLDIFWGPTVWEQMRETILGLRELQPDVMLRARGIGNYGDYYTPERFVPASKEATRMPWFVIYPLGSSFSYEKNSDNYKGPKWIVQNLVDATAKGGNFMVGVGPDGMGSFHPTAIAQLKDVGRWLKVNGEGIYATRPRQEDLWQEGETLRFTRSKDGRIEYCFASAWPGKSLRLSTIESRKVASAHMLGYPEKLRFRQEPSQGLTIDIPENLQTVSNRPCDYAWGFRVQYES